MSAETDRLLAAASAATGAGLDLIEAARDGEVREFSNVHAGEAAVSLADALRLTLDVMPITTDADDQLLGAVVRYLQEQEDHDPCVPDF